MDFPLAAAIQVQKRDLQLLHRNTDPVGEKQRRCCGKGRVLGSERFWETPARLCPEDLGQVDHRSPLTHHPEHRHARRSENPNEFPTVVYLVESEEGKE